MLMFFYTAYNLNIQSAIELPELLSGGDGTDVKIEFGDIKYSGPVDTGSNCLVASPDQVLLYWKDVGFFQTHYGNTITVEPLAGVPHEVLRLFVLGSCLAVLLRQRGLLVLHSSAVNIDGVVVSFIGDKGWGKSTTAAALHVRGHQLMSDDLVAIDFDEQGQPLVRPGYPQFKLWPEALASLGIEAEALPRIRQELDKRAHRPTEGFALDRKPLGCIYVLGGGPQLQLVDLPPQVSFLQLIRHVYVARYGTSFFQQTGSNEHFQQCTRLAHSVPIKMLQRQADLTALPDIASLIENDVRQAALSPSP